MLQLNRSPRAKRQLCHVTQFEPASTAQLRHMAQLRNASASTAQLAHLRQLTNPASASTA
jgi:hypothetical protein